MLNCQVCQGRISSRVVLGTLLLTSLTPKVDVTNNANVLKRSVACNLKNGVPLPLFIHAENTTDEKNDSTKIEEINNTKLMHKNDTNHNSASVDARNNNDNTAPGGAA